MTVEDDGPDAMLSPDDAFAIVGNDTRFRILRELWEAYDPRVQYDPTRSDNSLSFSELYNRVGYEDTGNFNYHLEKLTDHVVRRTETGYELTGLGFLLVRSVIAGTVSDRPIIEPEAVEEPCPRCGATIEITYESQRTVARCTSCPGIFGTARDGWIHNCIFHLLFPPAGWDGRSPDEVFHATVETNLHLIASFIDGTCPFCAGRVERSVHVCDSHEPTELEHCPSCKRLHLAEARVICSRCKASEWGPVTIAAMTHPAVIAFLHEHGIDHRFASWDTFVRSGLIDEEVRSYDPLCVQLTVRLDEETLTLTVDENLEIEED